MPTCKYDFEKLGWFNFEQLIGTLLRKVLGGGLSVFSGSADQGRDAVFEGKANSYPSSAEPWSGKWIVQVKYRTYSHRGAQSVRADLLSTFQDELLALDEKHSHDFDHYIFATNCPLTAPTKDRLRDSAASLRPGTRIGIIGENDLEQFLDNDPKLISSFPQLLGLGQLRILSAWGLHQRSINFLEAARSDIATFVVTRPYLRALDLLHQQHFCVLTGPPKMGKTCTAYAIAAALSTQGFQVFDLRKQEEFYTAFDDSEKQLFICDDVFGDIELRAENRTNWTRNLVLLLRRLGKNHKLIWTAREHILKEALSTSKLREDRPELVTTDKVTVAVHELSRLEKAMILYNHAQHSSLPDPAITFLKGRGSIRIIDHSNYSPETVRQLCDKRLLEISESTSGNIDSMGDSVKDFMTKPGEAWKTAFHNASSGEKLLCTQIMAEGGLVFISKLREKYNAWKDEAASELELFESALERANGTFLRVRDLSSDYRLVQFCHPSMRDLLADLIDTDRNVRFAYIQQLSLDELPRLFGLDFDPDLTHPYFGPQLKDYKDLEFLLSELEHRILPNASLKEVVAALAALQSFVQEALENYSKKVSLKFLSKNVTAVSSMNMILEASCHMDFWTRNKATIDLEAWKRLFEMLSDLLPFSSVDNIPSYIGGLIIEARDDAEIKYWALVNSIMGVAPTIARKYVDLDDHIECKTSLAESAKDALDKLSYLDIENDVGDNHFWHDACRSLIVDCDQYRDVFPDEDEPEEVREVRDQLEMHPRIELEDEEEPDPISPPEESVSDEQILNIFSDIGQAEADTPAAPF